MTGWKTWTGAAALFLGGVAKIAQALANFPDIDGATFKEGVELIGLGLVAVGIGHKLEKRP